MMIEKDKTGKVTLAGAGPGDEELITLKLMNRLATADVIITDRLVNPLIIEKYAAKDATVIFAGKQGYHEASMTQEQVTGYIVEQALSGKAVLRLKGGDTAFFSNIFDELSSLVEQGIPYEIIPGITAASGASAYTGIPLTARNFSQGVQLLTFNPNSGYSPEKWKQLAQTHDTLVFYMAAKNITDLAEILLRYTRHPSTPLAVIEQATTPFQAVHISSLQQCKADFGNSSFRSPSLVIIGHVVSLYDKFGWFNATENSGSVFRELEA
ncbi:MAG: uroporphyrinogen-III C-methyltransferase [Terrimonas sp.]|nr:uroporphyrinogen-III C-methyltransferase [Terrimonas sp.]